MRLGKAPWLLYGAVDTKLIPYQSWMKDRLNVASSELGAELRTAGLNTLDDVTVPVACALFERSLALIFQMPDLYRQVVEVVARVYLLKAEPGYDISHSEPRWRTTIFVSLPERDDEIGALRLSESIVHEAMHLTLTNWEAAHAFVDNDKLRVYSPWRDTFRPAQGVLHGLFVFLCIAAFLSQIKHSELGRDGATYVHRRLDAIESELQLVDLKRLRSSLTPVGVEALKHWLGPRPIGTGSPNDR
jgi:HEXXH motif-containing protein